MPSVTSGHNYTDGSDMSLRLVSVLSELSDLFDQFFQRNVNSLKLVLAALAAILVWPVLAGVCYLISRRIRRSTPPLSDPANLSKETYKQYMSLLSRVGDDKTPSMDSIDNSFVRAYLKSTLGLVLSSGDEYVDRVRAILAPLDEFAGKTTGGFTSISQVDAWKDRIKPYDYVA